MRLIPFALAAVLVIPWTPVAFAQNAAPDQPPSKNSSDSISKKDADPELALQKALSDAGNDRAAVVRNLKAYLQKYPDSPRKAAVYRAIVESCEQLQDNACSLEYAERFVALHPDDSEMMMLAVGILQEQGDDTSLERASGYVSRVLDRVEKSSVAEKPARVSTEAWQQHHDELVAALYSLRGQIEKSQKNYEAAEKDLQKSYAVKPNAMAAEQLGEIAELRHDQIKAINEYLIAFVLPDDGTSGKVDRRDVRKKLGNLWRQAHGSEQGLGEAVLTMYDRVGTPAPKPGAETRNQNAKDTFDFVLRKLDGSAVPLAAEKGKTLVLSFWATWCGPCRELEPEFAQVAKNYAGNPQIDFYAVNTDEDEAAVVPFLAHEKWSVPSVYADGLDVFMKVESLPTVVIIDRAGKISYRADGFMPDGFPETLTAAIQAAMGPAKP
jgi:thiol-disulfide isomerase/thioredoxin/transcriptional antiterminator Rof (Rho-off)